MSGVFGVIDSKRRPSTGDLVRSMGRAMTHRPWYQVDTVVEEAGVGLGRIGIGIFNRERQPVYSEDGRQLIFMSGELYNQDKIRRTLKQRGRRALGQGDPGLVLGLYQASGKSFVRDLEGMFVIAILDSSLGHLLLVNDRFGLYPTYYTQFGSRFIFAPEVKGILCDSDFRKKMNVVALAEYMRFQQLLGNKTFFEGIELLPPASLMAVNLNTGRVRRSTYWNFSEIPSRPDVCFEEAVEEASALLRQAVSRRSSDAYQVGVYLSGGLDSRTILGLIDPDHYPVPSITYGDKNSRDVVYARRTARCMGSEHYWLDLDGGNWVKDWSDLHLDLTEGFHSWIHAHGISTLPQARALFDVNLTGWGGGTVMGHRDSIEAGQVAAVDEPALVARLFHLFNQSDTWPSITEAEERQLYIEPLRHRILGLAFDSLRTELSNYLDYRKDIRSELFYVTNHCRRLTQNAVTFTRSYIEVRAPFFDYDLFNFLYSIPAATRGHQRLYRALIQHEIPRLAYIPCDLDNHLPTTRSWVREAHSLAGRLMEAVNRNLAPVFPHWSMLYADYENWLRNDLFDWGRAIFLSSSLSERGIFDPVFLRSLWRRHQAGHENHTIGKIAPIMTYELMLRRFVGRGADRALSGRGERCTQETA